jgi:ACS family tartrate transporter-like MFS transporter
MSDIDAEFEQRVVSKVSWRLLPYLFLLYVVAYVDRINVGVAKESLSRDLGLDPAVFGFGAGVFFLGYFLFEVPSNIMLVRVGARVWIARIMILWGLVTVAMMFVYDATSFQALRFLLGAAEAGFFPGIIFYLTRWFRPRDRAWAISLFMTAGTMAGAFGNPLSGGLLLLDGLWGLAGWQWLFLLEGIPAVLLGLSVPFLLTESPETARWLTREEAAWLCREVPQEPPRTHGGSSLLAGLGHPVVWHLAAVYFLLVTGAYGFEFWLPTIVKSLGVGGDFRAALVSAIPYIVATGAMLVVGRMSDRSGERRWHAAVSMAVSAAGFLASTRLLHEPVWALVALCVAWAGLKAAQGPFWAIPPAFLAGSAAAGGIALVNSVANLGGQVGPALAGFLERSTGSFTAGLLASAGLLAAGAVLAVLLPNPGQPTASSDRR